VALTLPDIATPLVDRQTGLIDERWYRALELVLRNAGTLASIAYLESIAGDINALIDQVNSQVTNLQQHVADTQNIVFTAGTGLSGGGSTGEAILTGDPISFALVTMADKYFLANFSGGVASPTPYALSSLVVQADFVEGVQDIVGNFTVAGSSKVTVVYSDAGNSLTIDLPYTPVNKAGDTMTGLLTLSGDPSTNLQAATKQYVDNAIAGLSWKQACVVATTANITLLGEQTIDGVLTSASRVLVKSQTLPATNGIYVSGAAAWVRSTDMDTGSEFPGAAVFIEQGSTLADTQWVCTNTTAPTVGVTSITFAQFGSGAGVTSVGLSAPAIFTVSGSPVTTTGTLTFVLATQSANTIFAGPTTGSAAAPMFRAMVSADLPSNGANPTATASDTAVNGSATTWMRSDGAPAIQKASASQFGIAKVDGTTITASGGVITAPANVPPGAAMTRADESTSSTSYVDLATVGPAVTMVTGTSVLVIYSGGAYKPSGGGNSCYMSVAVSGATTLAASDSWNATIDGNTFAQSIAGNIVVLTGLTAGTNTFTVKYKVNGSTFHFFDRGLAVFRLN
jgi:hypothetical protein